MPTKSIVKKSTKPATAKSAKLADLLGHCYCGAVRFRIKGDATVIRATFCHCESCRRAHAAPLYQVCYVSPNAFEFIAGAKLVKMCKFVADPEKGSRNFCGRCGTKVSNVMKARPGFPARTGFFPSTLDAATQRALPERFRPSTSSRIVELGNAQLELRRRGLELRRRGRWRAWSDRCASRRWQRCTTAPRRRSSRCQRTG